MIWHIPTRQNIMTDHDLLQQMIDRIGKELWTVKISAAAEAFPEFAPQMERCARRELDVVMGKEVEAEGTALRVFHVFLREVDKTQHWCGLKRVVTNDGNILWLCAEHARFHEV